MVLRRSPSVCAVLLASSLAACGSHPTGTTTPGGGRAQEAALHTLFEHLAEPTVTDDGPARLVLRDGPHVPTPGHVELAFPANGPDGGPPDAGPAGPLRVLGYSPRGSDTLVGALRVTFSQPMVPVEAVAATQAEHVPIQVSPQPPGRFRWLGTQTVVFEPEGVRMPFATEYTVTVPAGTTSAIGGALEQPVSFTFRTPPLAVVDAIPEGTSVELHPLIGLHFNQRVDAAAIASALQFAGGPRLTRLTTAAELDAAREEHPELGTWEDGRFVLFRAASALAVSTSYTTSLAAGTRGAEGPRGLVQPWAHGFRTYGPFALSGASCASAPPLCRPGDAIDVRMTNPVADGQDVDALVTVTPDVARLERRVGGDGISLSGDFVAATTYTVTIAAALKDVYGQTMAADAHVTKAFGDAYPSASFDNDSIATLELGSPRLVPVTVTNVHRVLLHAARITPDKIVRAAMGAQNGWWLGDHDPSDNPYHTLGVPERQTSLPVRGTRNAVERIGADVTPEVAAGQPGLALVTVDLPERDLEQRQSFLVQATDLGLTGAVDAFGAVARVTSLSQGTPQQGVTVELRTSDDHVVTSATTDATGMARMASTRMGYGLFLVARRGADTALVRAFAGGVQPTLIGSVLTERNPYRPGDVVHMRALVRKRLADARGTIQSVASGTALHCHLGDPQGGSQSFDATTDEFGTFVHDLETTSDAPTGQWNVGCRADGETGYTEIGGVFSVEEYRAPEIAVHVTTPEGTRFHGDAVRLTVASEYLFGAPAAGLPVRWTLGREATDFSPPGHAEYTFGDAVHWRWGRPVHVHRERRWGRDRAFFGMPQAEREIVKHGEGVLDAQGKLEVPATLAPGDDIDGPAKFVLEASVTDTSRQEIAGRVEVIAHPASLYAGVRMDQPFIRETDPILLHAIVANVDGALQAGKQVTVRAIEQRGHLTAHVVAGSVFYAWETEDHEVGTCTVTSAAAPADCRIGAQRAGQYVLEASVRDERGRTQTTRTLVWVFGGTYVPSENAGTIELLADHSGPYEPGTTAHLLVRAPFANGRGFLALERAGIVETRPLDLDGNLHVVDVPLHANDVPQLGVRVLLARGRASDAELAALLAQAGPDARQAAADDVGRPTWGAGQLTLAVKDTPKRLVVDVHPDHEALGPGEHLGVDLSVHDAAGHGKETLVAVALVDEGVLSLLHYETPDPVPLLHPAPGDTTEASSVFDTIVRRRQARALANGAVRERMLMAADDVGDSFGYGGLGLRGTGRGGGGTGEGTIGLGNIGTIGHGAGTGSGQGYGSGAGGFRSRASAAPTTTAQPDSDRRNAEASGGETAGETPTAARGLFATTAFYAANVRTDRDGKAHVDVTLPDNLTTFRIMAIAVARDDTSGSGDATVRVRKPVVLRPALPRFATWGDSFQAQVVVHNETGEASEVVVGVRAAGLAVEGDGIERVHLAAGESKLVAFPVHVDAGRGKARVQFAASAGHGSDAAELDLPIVEPATAEAFATYGSVTPDQIVRIPVHAPAGVIDRFGGLDLQLASTQMQGLDDAADWLIDYPYLCAEQHADRVIAGAALSQILGGGRNDAGAAHARDLAVTSVGELRHSQRYDGGFVYWPEMIHSELYVSTWVVFALGEAKRAGIAVPQAMLDNGLQFVERRVRYPEHYLGEDTDYAAQAFGLYVLGENGHTPPADLLTRVHSHRRDLPVFASAWLDSALRKASRTDARAAELWRQITNASIETAGSAHFAEQRVESARLLWHSERRTDAIVLVDLLERDWHDPLAEKTVRGLVASRRDGHWETTNETAWALTALVRYYRLAEADVPDLRAQAWVGPQLAFEASFQGRTSAVAEGRLPMHDLLAMGDDVGFVMQPQGTGRLYYRLGLKYAPRDLHLPPAEEGFSVTRRYEPVGDPSTVTRDADGVWHIKLESDVRVRVSVIVQDDRYDVALDDPLPAGLEATNMAFATTATQRLSGSLDEQRVDFGNYWALFAFDHREMRDDRVVAFARYAPAGVYELTYLARATTPGRYLAQATHAEEMYAPENFGRATSETVVVEE